MLEARHAILLQNANILDWRHVTYAILKKTKRYNRYAAGEREGGGEGGGGGAAEGFAGRPLRIDSGFGENHQNEITSQIISMQDRRTVNVEAILVHSPETRFVKR